MDQSKYWYNIKRSELCTFRQKSSCCWVVSETWQDWWLSLFQPSVHPPCSRCTKLKWPCEIMCVSGFKQLETWRHIFFSACRSLEGHGLSHVSKHLKWALKCERSLFVTLRPPPESLLRSSLLNISCSGVCVYAGPPTWFPHEAPVPVKTLRVSIKEAVPETFFYRQTNIQTSRKVFWEACSETRQWHRRQESLLKKTKRLFEESLKNKTKFINDSLVLLLWLNGAILHFQRNCKENW